MFSKPLYFLFRSMLYKFCLTIMKFKLTNCEQIINYSIATPFSLHKYCTMCMGVTSFSAVESGMKCPVLIKRMKYIKLTKHVYRNSYVREGENNICKGVKSNF